MLTQASKIPKWKRKEKENREASFDGSLNSLGVNSAFLNAKEVRHALLNPVSEKINVSVFTFRKVVLSIDNNQ